MTMLVRAHIEALLINETLADYVWDAWAGDEIADATAYITWLLIALSDADGSGK